jgi:CheY-like chemotaxis protein
MTQPLALVLYERLLPGSQLVNRLQDLNYRVQTVPEASRLMECAEQASPLLVLVDLGCTRADVCAAITRVRQNPATRHLPIVAFGGDPLPARLQSAAEAAGATLVVSETGILNHLPQFLEQALRVE